MSARLLGLLSLVAVGLAMTGCAADADEMDDEEEGSTESNVLAQDKEGPAEMPEAVRITMPNGGFCTGVLVSARVALTAAHCTGQNSFTVESPVANKKQKAKLAERISESFGTNPAASDIAVLKLDGPINLAHYAAETEIGGAADKGKSFKGIAVGRAKKSASAGLVRTKTMTITSAANLGYTTGLKTPYYSTGGDSGGPLFLVENGKVTHKLVGIERQPEPGRDDDYFSRIDGKVKAAIKRASN